MFARIFLFSIILLSGVFTVNAQSVTNCKTCGTTLLKAENIYTLSVDELRLLTNEIYARKGYKFTNENIQDYFRGFEWYKPLNNNSLVKLSALEEKNVKLLTDRCKLLEGERQIIFTYFKGLKQFAINNNENELNKVLNKPKYEDLSSVDNFKDVLKRIDFDDVHWYKNNALYKVEIDNGYVKTVYSFSITSKGIMLMYNYMSHSEIMENFDTPFSDYMSENEYAVWWTFSIQTGKVVLTNINGAG
ncbi:YARHG domain-containing protein [Flavobacterium sp. AJR]|uniref:YARHG domain-containing protein n=1 Tax=Flavobacterium sp. AJR TaxID=1979369 RepID=UPI000A3D6882|nr:YARHG domain-containing protein [Flavobacterium sp. AJR]OUL61048.1 hypothetical protein B8T70_17245 [Flavobacterium sp. AJR]